MRSPLTIMTVYSVASRLPSLRSALRGLDITSVHGQLKSWATAKKPPAGALTKKIFRTQTRYSWCPRNRGNSGGKPPTFDFLGFTHYWGRSRKGKAIVKRKTARDRLARSLKRVTFWCKRNRHLSVADQHRYLQAVLRGHYSYYGLTGNNKAMSTFWHQVKRIWHYWLQRRSQRRCLNWERFNALLKRPPLPWPRIVHSIYRDAANPCA